jgi:DNA-binding CsgD family transcriptional regulator
MRRIKLDQRVLLTLIDGAYEAAQDAAPWGVYLQKLNQTIGGAAAFLMHHDLRGRGDVYESVGMDPDGVDLYNRYYGTIDPWAVGPRTPSLFAAPVVTGEQLSPRSVLCRGEYYNDFATRFDRTRLVTMALAPGPAYYGISILRRERDPEFGKGEVRFLSWLAPHLRRALRLRDCLRATADERSALLDGLDALPCAIVIVDGSARAVLTNRAGAELEIERDGVGVRHGVLVAGSARASRRLAQLVATAAGDHKVDRATGGTMVLQGSRSPLHVLVAPVRGAGGLKIAHDRARAFVFVSDPSRHRLPSEYLLQRYYALTRSEAEVAARIGAGRSLEEIANERRTTIGTIRWYNKQVLAKTGCSNRAQLVRQLTRGLPGLLFPED